MTGQIQFSYGLIKSAVLSEDGRYRYTLTRTWHVDRPVICWVMLNPSTADADNDDNTIRKIRKFSETWGYGGLVVVNLFALRSKNPKALYGQGGAVVGPENDRFLLSTAREASFVVAAWGNHGAYRDRQREVVAALRGAGVVLHHLGLTKYGHPNHPLYLKDSTRPEAWT